jgi:hypothetical protein
LGVYEFGTVPDTDGPVIVDGAPLAPAFNVAVINAWDQFVDGSFTAASVTVDTIGWLVIHSNNEGAPGPVLGATQIQPGINTDVTVALDGDASGSVWPMLHVDTGVEGTYEFGTVADTDGPVRVNDAVVVFPIDAAPSIVYNVHVNDAGDALVIESALIDAPGWMVIHSDNGGSPGPVLGYVALTPGWNEHITVPIADMSAVGTTVFPMLHYDTGQAGVYEFGSVADADTPVRVGGNVVVGPAEVMSGM